jgi:putative peptidoglycan binding protein
LHTGWTKGDRPLRVEHARITGPSIIMVSPIKLVQEQLGQLNYYNGPVTGYMNHGTVQAITYLQRGAHLPHVARRCRRATRISGGCPDG